MPSHVEIPAHSRLSSYRNSKSKRIPRGIAVEEDVEATTETTKPFPYHSILRILTGFYFHPGNSHSKECGLDSVGAGGSFSSISAAETKSVDIAFS